MESNIASLNELINRFARLPGIGKKSARRLAYSILEGDEESAIAFANAIVNAKKNITFCSCCQGLSDGEFCPICKNENRNRSIICVVGDTKDIDTFEKTGEYNGVYHVLHGLISPMDGIGPEDIRIKELLSRINAENVTEIIMATNPTVEGEATASYIARLIKPLGITISRLAYGMPVGASLEFADAVTLAKALQGRNLI